MEVVGNVLIKTYCIGILFLPALVFFLKQLKSLRRCEFSGKLLRYFSHKFSNLWHLLGQNRPIFFQFIFFILHQKSIRDIHKTFGSRVKKTSKFFNPLSANPTMVNCEIGAERVKSLRPGRES